MDSYILKTILDHVTRFELKAASVTAYNLVKPFPSKYYHKNCDLDLPRLEWINSLQFSTPFCTIVTHWSLAFEEGVDRYMNSAWNEQEKKLKINICGENLK